MPAQPETGAAQSKRKPTTQATTKKAPNRKFFHHVEPTFSVAAPKVQELQFLDHADPNRNLVVRKKAREWVHRNKQQSLIVSSKPTDGKKKKKGKQKKHDGDDDAVIEFELVKREKGNILKFETISKSLCGLSEGKADPFETFPSVGRNIDHILEFFFTSCPPEVPCTDDKYAWRSQPHTQITRKNSVLSSMAEDYVSFVVWLYATTLIRDGITTMQLSEECLHFYKLSLQAMQMAVNQVQEEFPDSLVCALACFTACASFSGMYEAAEMHCNAMIKSITLQGGGDIVKGFAQYKPFTQKAAQWCELGVSVQKRVLPMIPYTIFTSSASSLPHEVALEANRRASVTMSNIPQQVSPYFGKIFQLMHLLCVSQSKSPTTKVFFPNDQTANQSIIGPMYDLQWMLLNMANMQSNPPHEFNEFDIMLTEACELFFWIGPRGLPPENSLCALQVDWLKSAIVPVLELATKPEDTDPLGFSQSSLPVRGTAAPLRTSSREKSTVHIISTPRTVDNALLWALYLGTITSKARNRPEYPWFEEQMKLRMQMMGAKSRADLLELMKMFPDTEYYHWIDMERVATLFTE